MSSSARGSFFHRALAARSKQEYEKGTCFATQEHSCATPSSIFCFCQCALLSSLLQAKGARMRDCFPHLQTVWTAPKCHTLLTFAGSSQAQGARMRDCRHFHSRRQATATSATACHSAGRIRAPRLAFLATPLKKSAKTMSKTNEYAILSSLLADQEH